MPILRNRNKAGESKRTALTHCTIEAEAISHKGETSFIDANNDFTMVYDQLQQQNQQPLIQNSRLDT